MKHSVAPKVNRRYYRRSS